MHRRSSRSLFSVLTAVLLATFSLVLFIFATATPAPVESSSPNQKRISPTATVCRNSDGFPCTPTRTRQPTRTPTRTPVTPSATPREPTDTPWPSDTPTNTPTETETPTPTVLIIVPLPPTDTPTPRPTDTATQPAFPSPTASITLAPTAAPSDTPTLTAPPPPGAHIVISEFRTRGLNGESDQFVEIYNPSNAPVNIGGWKIQTLPSGPAIQPTAILTITREIVLQPGFHFLAANGPANGYRGAVAPDQTFDRSIPGDGAILLTTGDDALIDGIALSPATSFRRGAPLSPLTTNTDTSYERKLGGVAGSCIDTGSNADDLQPRTPSDPQDLASPPTLCGSTATFTPTPTTVAAATPIPSADPSAGVLDFRSTFFYKNIAGPRSFFDAGLATAITNLLLALLLALAFGIFATLLSDTIESNEPVIRSWLAPLAGLVRYAEVLSVRLGARLKQSGIAWLVDLAKLALIMLAYGVVFAFLDPSFSLFNPDAWLLILSLALSVALVALTDDLAKLFYMRHLGSDVTLRIHSGNILLVAFSVLVARVISLTPGFLFGTPGGLEGKEKGDPARVSLLVVGGLAALSLVGWLGTLLFPAAGASGLGLWLATVMLLVFGAGIQTLFFEMVPLRFLYGRAILKSSRVLWAVLFVVISFFFVQTMLNPNGSFLAAFQRSNMQALALFVAGFCIFAFAVWLYFNRRSPSGAAST